MQVSDPNNVKIYNLSAGKSLPEWLSERKRRKLLKTNVDIRRRIELIQDFEMPGVSTSVRVSPDGQYVLATGIYKPRVRCYETDNLSMKFERCFDSEVVTFEVLSEDYSKVVFLQCDRYVEFHSGSGRYYRLRIPKFGRDMKYHAPSTDLFLVGATSDIYRLNLERGQFLQPFLSQGSELNSIAINPVHQLICVGTLEGKVEAWDPRMKVKIGTLDCAFNCISNERDTVLEGFPSITALNFQGPLTLGVGTHTGQILLYDIRADRPLRVKDHMYGLPIRDVRFHENHVLSMDSSVVKIWNKNDGSLFTCIESGEQTQFNNLCHIPDSGMMFIANENKKVLTYYIPSLGPAPKWCGFLDNLTEELEENIMDNVYDDYKFVTRQELEDLGLGHLIGTTLLRAYMHGFFMDVRLYRKAKSVSAPFEFEEFKKKKIREKIEQERTRGVQLNKLPQVNQELALKLMDEKQKAAETDSKKKKKKLQISANLLEDARFQGLFQNPDFQVDTTAEEYRLLTPVLTRLDKQRQKQLRKQLAAQELRPVKEEREGKASSDESSEEEEEEEERYLSDTEAGKKIASCEGHNSGKKHRPPSSRQDSPGQNYKWRLYDVGTYLRSVRKYA
uniref:Nucleolar protein 10 n=1 Tax=Cacopsylla melanoneura TaxID=428564 RepID=A0A8D8SGU2_9HEMI